MKVTIIESAGMTDYTTQIKARLEAVEHLSVEIERFGVSSNTDKVDAFIIPITSDSLRQIPKQGWEFLKAKHQAKDLLVLPVLMEKTSWLYMPISQVFPVFPSDKTLITPSNIEAAITEIFNYLTTTTRQEEPSLEAAATQSTENKALSESQEHNSRLQQFLAKAKTAEAEGNFQAAIDYYNKIIAESKDASLVLTYRAEVTTLEQKVLFDNLIEKGRKAYQRGNLEEALKAFKTAESIEKSERLRKTINKIESIVRKIKVDDNIKRERRVKWLAVVGTVVFAVGILFLIQYMNRPKPIVVEENVLEEGYPMILVKGGTFEMGANAFEDQKPSHKVTVDSFYIGKYEVTVELFDAFCEDQGLEFVKLASSNPRGKTAMTHVSWFEACQFANWLSRKDGYSAAYVMMGETVIIDSKSDGYRLPTEAQWEFAAIGGRKVKKYLYAGGNYTNDVAWNADNSKGKVHAIGQLKPNDLGIHDMSGNVWEWCWDWHKEGYYHHESINPTGANFGYYRVMRGGSWYSEDFYLRPRTRMMDVPTTKDVDLGFRLVRPI